MGQKVNPILFRLGRTENWNSCWYDEYNYADLLHSDLQIGKYICGSLRKIDKVSNRIKVTRAYYTKTPGTQTHSTRIYKKAIKYSITNVDHESNRKSKP